MQQTIKATTRKLRSETRQAGGRILRGVAIERSKAKEETNNQERPKKEERPAREAYDQGFAGEGVRGPDYQDKRADTGI